MKVLVIGREVSDFMCPLFKTMREQYNISVDLFEMRDKEQIQKSAYTSFDNVLDISLKINSNSKSFVLSSLMTSFFVKELFKTRNIKDALRKAVLHKKMLPVIRQYDIVHTYFITPELFAFFDAINASKKLVVSMWGSDMYHNNKDFNYDDHKKLIDRADYVTVHHKEMKEVFLSKFGRVNEPKVREMLVLDDANVLTNYIADKEKKQTSIENFRKRYNIAPHKRIVAVGHSGHVIDNHIQIVESLASAKDRLSKDICLVFPVTYGCATKTYSTDIMAACDKLGIQHVVLTEFLPYNELVELRFASEIVLRLSSFDAFSLSLTESLCTGNVAIVGAWLPYGKFRGNNVYMKEVYEFDELKNALIHVLDNYQDYENLCTANADNVLKIFRTEKSAARLNKIYA